MKFLLIYLFNTVSVLCFIDNGIEHQDKTLWLFQSLYWFSHKIFLKLIYVYFKDRVKKKRYSSCCDIIKVATTSGPR